MPTMIDTRQLTAMLDEWESSIQRDRDRRTLPIEVVEAHQNAINVMRDEMRGLECDECSDPWTERREAGNFCAHHASEFVTCDGCQCDVPFRDAVTPVSAEGGFYHPACCPPCEREP